VIRKKFLLTGAIALGTAFAMPFAALYTQAQTAPQAGEQAGKKHKVSMPGTQQHQDEGQRIFEQNCSRCHNAPEGFSPNISGTIVRHMRVRASLSQHDEQELLRFLNP
jgi:cytochrome c5